MSAANNFLFSTGRDKGDGKSMCAWQSSANPTTEELLAVALKKPIYLNLDHYQTMLFKDDSIAILLPIKARPISIFPQVKFQMNETKHVENAPFLAILQKGSPWICNITLTFQDVNHFFPVFDVHFTLSDPYPDNIHDAIYGALQGITWESKMRECAQSIGLPLNRMVFFWKNGKSNDVLFPGMKPLDYVKANFNSDFTLYKPAGDLFYRIIKDDQSFSGDYTFLTKTHKLNIKSMDTFFDSILQITEKLIGANYDDSISIEQAKSTLSKLSIDTLLAIVSRMTNPRFDLTEWSEYVALFKAVSKNPEHTDSLKDFSQSSLALINFISQTKNIFSRLVQFYTKIHLELRRLPKDPNNNLFGRVVYSCFVNVADSPYTLLITTGFLEIMNFSPSNTTTHEILPNSYSFKCVNSSPLLFCASLTLLQVCPLTNTSCVVINDDGSFVINFPNNTALTDFVLIFHVRQFAMNEKYISPPLPFYGASTLSINFSSADLTTLINFDIKLLDKNWSLQMKLNDFVNKITQKCQKAKALAIPSLLRSTVPNHIQSSANQEILGINVTTDTIFKELRRTNTDAERTLRFITALIMDGINSQSHEITYETLNILGIASLTQAITLRSPQMLRLCATVFPAQFSEHIMLDDNIANFAATYLTDLRVMRELMKHVSITDRSSAAANGALRNPGGSLQVLTDSGAILDAIYPDDVNPLIQAIDGGMNEKIIELLRKGAPANSSRTELASALRFAIAKDNLDAVKLMAPFLGDAINVATLNGEFPIHTCIICERCAILEALISLCPKLNPNISSKNFALPIHYILQKGECLKILRALMHHPAIDLNAYNKDGRTPLSIAIDTGRFVTLRVLLGDKRCDPNYPDFDGTLPIHKAAAGGNKFILDTLIEYGANVNAPAPDGTTALYIAVKARNDEMIESLMNAGANPSLWMVNGKSIDDISTPEIRKMLFPEGKSHNINYMDYEEEFRYPTLMFKDE